MTIVVIVITMAYIYSAAGHWLKMCSVIVVHDMPFPNKYLVSTVVIGFLLQFIVMSIPVILPCAIRSTFRKALRMDPLI